MDNQQKVLEHPFVTRVKTVKLPTNSPTLTIRDYYQPSQGYIFERLTFEDYAKEALN